MMHGQINIRLKKSETVFMKGEKLKAMDRWRLNSQNSKVVDKLCFVDIFLENTVRWSKWRTLTKAKGCQAFVTVVKCLSVTHNGNVHTLQSIHDMECESKIRYEVDWGGGGFYGGFKRKKKWYI